MAELAGICMIQYSYWIQLYTVSSLIAVVKSSLLMKLSLLFALPRNRDPFNTFKRERGTERTKKGKRANKDEKDIIYSVTRRD